MARAVRYLALLIDPFDLSLQSWCGGHLSLQSLFLVTLDSVVVVKASLCNASKVLLVVVNLRSGLKFTLPYNTNRLIFMKLYFLWTLFGQSALGYDFAKDNACVLLFCKRHSKAKCKHFSTTTRRLSLKVQ